MKNKSLSLLAVAVSAAFSSVAYADINKIIISEYVEGSSNNKAIELTNVGPTDYTFTDSVKLYYDGGKYQNDIRKADGSSVIDGVTIPAGESIVVIHGEASQELINAISANNASHVIAGTYDEVRFNSLNFNGDDSVYLGLNKTDIHDIVGVAGSEWGKDVTFRRINTSTVPKATFNSDDWVSSAKDDFSGLGDATLAPTPGQPMPCTDGASQFEEKTIGQAQGNGFSSPLIAAGKYKSDQEYLITGVVSAVTIGEKQGFYLYSDDGDITTSDGLFIETAKIPNTDLVGQKVCVRGFVEEDYGLTKLVAANDEWELLDANAGAPTAVDLVKIPQDGDNFQATLERHEGMLVRLPADIAPEQENDQTMRISRTFSFDYSSFRNNMVLAYERPNFQPNQHHVAGSEESKQHAKENNDRRLYVETDKKSADGEIPFYPDFALNPSDNYLRVNDSIVGLDGVLTYSFNNFRLIAMNEITDANIIHHQDREDKPSVNDETEHHSFDVRIATLNVLNYFNSPFGGDDNPLSSNRGADSESEFERQEAKIVEAIYGLDADIIGLMEIENNGYGRVSAISRLVNTVNLNYDRENPSDKGKPDHIDNRYAFIGIDSNGDTVVDELDTLGGDAITSGMLYRPARVSLEKVKQVLMPSQKAPVIADENGAALVDSKGLVRESGKNYQRDMLAASFIVNYTGKRLTVGVNHLKSKGSTCWEDWQGWETWENFDPIKGKVKDDDFQGSCENFRVAAADEIGKQMEKWGGDRVIIGDLNSYAHEDPLLVLTNNPTGKTLKAARDTFIGEIPQFGENGAIITKSYGYINAVEMMRKDKEYSGYSYSYNDEIGSLDHILVSPSLKDRVLDATDWHINAAESTLFDYNEEYKGANADLLYSEDAYRSSDHDPAILALGYRYNQVGEVPIQMLLDGSRLAVPYTLPETAKAGDIASIVISPTPEDSAQLTLPKITLKEDGAQTIMFDVNGLKAGAYTFTMSLTKGAQAKSATVDSASVSINVNVKKRDGFEAEVVTPPNDGSGGSMGIVGLLSLLGLGFLRRRFK
ncbi:nuclease [Photobacterium sp. GB-50]|uniref:ExeM/NucH family extracellular endonuclease n=1 Tax=Photobacterium sp. GB-50 TaxID=2022107 RepID=UPI000D15CDF6|nr:ExeM/NucH family extracellular endonuclease [Photobacterium sp. GB-50]PSW72341.1 nuclease [Photobacterium sp. GB-50]